MAGGGGCGMTCVNPHWLDHQRKRWMRPDGERWLQPDRRLWIRPDALVRKYDPDQPRVPAGNSDGGQGTSGGDAGNAGSDRGNGTLWGLVERVAAHVIRICIAGSRSLATDHWGNKTYWVSYECAGGRSYTERGTGHWFPGIVRDPFR